MDAGWQGKKNAKKEGPKLWPNHNNYAVSTLRLLLLTGSNFSNFAILFTFRVLILAILDSTTKHIDSK